MTRERGRPGSAVQLVDARVPPQRSSGWQADARRTLFCDVGRVPTPYCSPGGRSNIPRHPLRSSKTIPGRLTSRPPVSRIPIMIEIRDTEAMYDPHQDAREPVPQAPPGPALLLAYATAGDHRAARPAKESFSTVRQDDTQLANCNPDMTKVINERARARFA